MKAKGAHAHTGSQRHGKRIQKKGQFSPKRDLKLLTSRFQTQDAYKTRQDDVCGCCR